VHRQGPLTRPHNSRIIAFNQTNCSAWYSKVGDTIPESNCVNSIKTFKFPKDDDVVVVKFFLSVTTFRVGVRLETTAVPVIISKINTKGATALKVIVSDVSTTKATAAKVIFSDVSTKRATAVMVIFSDVSTKRATALKIIISNVITTKETAFEIIISNVNTTKATGPDQDGFPARTLVLAEIPSRLGSRQCGLHYRS